MSFYCPGCDQENEETRVSCQSCGAKLLIDGRYGITAAQTPVGEDVVDNAATLRVGQNVENKEPVLVRLAGIGEEERLRKEAVILRGLNDASIPRVLFVGSLLGSGVGLVLSAPSFPTLRAQVEDGLRIDDLRARSLITALLGALTTLQSLSPPVFHRNLHPGAVAWDGKKQVWLLDFARASDVIDDVRSDLIVTRQGYAPSPSTTASPAQLDLYGLAATVVHVLTRREVADLPQKDDGTPDFRAAMVVSDEVELFLERLLQPQAKNAPQDVHEANSMWAASKNPKPVANASVNFANEGPVSSMPASLNPMLAILAAMVFAMVTLGSVAGFFFMSTEVTPMRPSSSMSVASVPVPVSQKRPASASSSGASQSQRPPSMAAATQRAAKNPFLQTPKKSRRARTASVDVLFRKAALSSRKALLACDDAKADRVAIRVELDRSGRVKSTKRIGRSHQKTATCVEKVLKTVRLPAAKVSKATTLDVWVWTHPRLKINVH